MPPEADLVCYWFVKAAEQIASGKAARAGLVDTNSMRGAALFRAAAGRYGFAVLADGEPRLLVVNPCDRFQLLQL